MEKRRLSKQITDADMELLAEHFETRLKSLLGEPPPMSPMWGPLDLVKLEDWPKAGPEADRWGFVRITFGPIVDLSTLQPDGSVKLDSAQSL